MTVLFMKYRFILGYSILLAAQGLIIGCGARESKSLINSASISLASDDPLKASPEFNMTRELPDVTRRLTNWLGTCWLEAGIKEMELSYYNDTSGALPLSVEFMLMTALRNRYYRMVQGEYVREADLQAGGELNEVRSLTAKNGVIPETSWGHRPADWARLSKILNPLAGKYREQFRDHERRGTSTSAVLDRASETLDQTLRQFDLKAPERITVNGKSTTPMRFASDSFRGDPAAYILYIAAAQRLAP